MDESTAYNQLCTGYWREELTLTDAISDHNALVHPTPPSRVFFWDTNGQVVRGVVRSTLRGVDVRGI